MIEESPHIPCGTILLINPSFRQNQKGGLWSSLSHIFLHTWGTGRFWKRKGILLQTILYIRVHRSGWNNP